MMHPVPKYVKDYFRRHRLARRLPPAISKLIKGRVVDFTNASPYFRRLAADARIRIQAELEVRGDFRYSLGVRLFAFFRFALLELVANPPADTEDYVPGDFVAQAIYRTAWLYGNPIPAEKDDRFDLWPPSKPIAHAWERLGTYAPLSGGERLVLEELPTGELRFPNPGFLLPRIEQRITYNTDKNKLPKITIEIEGEPASVLYRSRYVLRDPEERAKIRREAKRLLESLCRHLLITFQVRHSKANRPVINLGQEAAYLHDHKRLSWRKVAQKACPRNHTHDFGCQTNLRKQAEQWYRRNLADIKRCDLPSAQFV